MKFFRYAFLLGLFALLSSTGAHAQLMGLDSASVDSVSSYQVLNPENAMGKLDAKYAQLSKGCFIDLAVKAKTGGLYYIAPGAKIRIYGRNIPGDSSAAQINFVKTTNGFVSYTSHNYYATGNGMTELTAPDSQYTYIELTTTGGTDLKGSNSYLLDAIVVVQNYRAQGVATRASFDNSASLSNYPNPCHPGPAATMLAITTARSGDAMVVVADPTGREISRVAMGEIAPGAHEVPLAIEESGIYFAQLYLDGLPVGRARKLSAIR